jgi:uncharacterized protein
MHQVTNEADLRARYRDPVPQAIAKQHDRLDAAKIRFIERSPFVLLATADSHGNCDVSPRGGPPGFVAVLDDTHVAIPDLNGNNRLDSYANIVANPNAGLLFLVPGKDDTVRLNGPAWLTDEQAVLDRCTAELRRPKLAVVVEVREVFVHCAKAFRRAELWQPTSWDRVADAPDMVDMFTSTTTLGDGDAVRELIEQSYVADLEAD